MYRRVVVDLGRLLVARNEPRSSFLICLEDETTIVCFGDLEPWFIIQKYTR